MVVELQMRFVMCGIFLRSVFLFCWCVLRGALQRLGVASLGGWSSCLSHILQLIRSSAAAQEPWSSLHPLARLFPLVAVVYMAIELVLPCVTLLLFLEPVQLCAPAPLPPAKNPPNRPCLIHLCLHLSLSLPIPRAPAKSSAEPPAWAFLFLSFPLSWCLLLGQITTTCKWIHCQGSDCFSTFVNVDLWTPLDLSMGPQGNFQPCLWRQKKVF